jgi:hypothetical protein
MTSPAQATATSGEPASFPRWLLAGFLILLAVSGAVQCWKLAQSVHSAWDSVVEGDQVFASMRFARGGPVYTLPDRPPYTATLYGPLFYISMGSVDRLTAPRSFAAFAVEGRTLVFLSYFLVAFLAWRLARRLGAGPWFSLAAPLFILCDGSFATSAAAFRPDVPALLLALLGFCVITRDPEPRPPRIIGAGLLMGAAFLFKQPFLAAPAAAFLWLLWKRRIRSAFLLALAALFPVAIVVGSLELRGEPVLYSLLLPRHTLYELGGELAIILLLGILSPTMTLEAPLALVGINELWKRDKEAAVPMALYLVVAAAIGLGTMAQVGADGFYLIETMALAAILAAVGLESWMARLAAATRRKRLAAGFLLFAIPLVNIAAWMRGGPPPDYASFTQAVAGHRLISTIPYLAAQGKDPEMVDTWVNSLYEKLGQWSPAPVLQQVQNQEFDYVVVALDASKRQAGPAVAAWRGVPVLSPSILRQVQQDYQLAGVCLGGAVEVFVPSQEPRGRLLAARLAPICGWSAAKGAANPP